MTEERVQELESEYGAKLPDTFITDTGCYCDLCEEELENRMIGVLRRIVAREELNLPAEQYRNGRFQKVVTV